MGSAATTTANTILLRDGRTLGYAQFGDPDGAPVVFLHGWCGSRLTRHPDDALTASLRTRLITVDRPGVGLSDRKRGRRLLDWPDDLAELLDQLSIQRFALIAHSGGGPHALACGVRMADRISRIGVVSGFAPMHRPGATDGMLVDMRRAVPLLGHAPWLAGPMLRSLPDAYRRDPQAAWEAQFGRDLPPADRAELAQPAVRDNILAAAVEALRSGGQGVADELPLFLGRRWGFDPAEVRLPTSLWYGQVDVVAPIQMGRFLASVIPQAQLIEYPNEGHMVYVSHWPDILRATLAPIDH
jgi:pimeloyl-ACP methyl ester carboxylesterase